MVHIHIETVIQADPFQVWERLSDHASMPEWSPLSRVELTPGTPAPNGMGAVRRMYMLGPLPPIVEEVVAWDAASTYSYTLRAGAPIRNHLGQVTVSAHGDHSHVTWQVSFEPVIPGTGWLIKAVLDRALRSMLKRLERLMTR
jgi:uncharacterized protein YndB with AHSA1/START domain